MMFRTSHVFNVHKTLNACKATCFSLHRCRAGTILPWSHLEILSIRKNTRHVAAWVSNCLIFPRDQPSVFLLPSSSFDFRTRIFHQICLLLSADSRSFSPSPYLLPVDLSVSPSRDNSATELKTNDTKLSRPDTWQTNAVGS